jgi:anti-sigma-K factor RskA
MSGGIDETPEGDPPVAAEYALGVLGAEERAAVERRIADDADFAAEVEWWENRLAPLAAEIPHAVPREEVWDAVAHAVLRERRGRPELWNSVGLWRGAAAVAAAAAILIAVAPRPETPPSIALIAAPDDRGPRLVVSLDHARERLVITSTKITTSADQSPELWIIPPGQQPQSLGVIPARDYSLPLPAALWGRGSKAVLAVTLEQQGGSPDGRPHGPIVAQGEIL